jgi:hypothetical protein
MLAAWLDVVALASQALERRLVVLEYDRDVTLLGACIGSRHQVDLGSSSVQPDRSALDPGRRGHLRESQQRIENDALIEVGLPNLARDVVDDRDSISANCENMDEQSSGAGARPERMALTIGWRDAELSADPVSVEHSYHLEGASK